MMGPMMYVQSFDEAVLQRLVSMAALKYRSTAVASDPTGKQGLLGDDSKPAGLEECVYSSAQDINIGGNCSKRQKVYWDGQAASIALAIEILQSCSKQSICTGMCLQFSTGHQHRLNVGKDRGLVQNCGISSSLALEMFCTRPGPSLQCMH